MIILHGGELDGSLVIWAETPESKKPRGRKPRPDAMRRYPFGIDAIGLEGILGSLGLRPRATYATNVWLPTRANGNPIPSSGMIDGYSSRPASAKRVPWTIDVAELSGADAIEMLCGIMGNRTITREGGGSIIIGSDLAYMVESMRLAGLIVAGQQYLPDIRPSPDAERMSDGWHEVSWSPVFSTEYSEQFESLSGRMPGAVRAITKIGRGRRNVDMSYRNSGPKNPPEAVLRRFVGRLADHLIRTAAAAQGAGGGAPNSKFDSVHDAWLYHLRAPDVMDVRGHGVSLLCEQVEEWKRPVTSAARSPLRLCFRLEEAREQDGAWFIRYLLQPRSDPSLLVPADAAWEAKSSTVALPRGVNAKEFLLTSLGQAAGIMPSLTGGRGSGGAATGSGGMKGCATDTGGAYRFLTKEATALRQAGYGVILPAWWTGRGSKIRAKANIRTPRTKSSGMFDFRSVVSFDWKIAIGDQEMTIGELRKLARAKAPLVMMRGEWTEVSPDDIKRAIKFLQRGAGGKKPLMDALKMGIGVPGAGGTGDAAPTGADSKGIDIEVTSEDSRILRILDQIHDKTKMKGRGQPAGFSGELRPYQLRGFSWMSFLQRWGLGGCLADDMGLGKTIQVLALIQQYKRQRSKKDGSDAQKPFLLICPTSVISNWKKEAQRFTPELDVMVHHGSDRASGAAAFRREAQRHDVVVSSYGLMHRDLKAIRNAGWGGIVLDEAQNIKNPHTKQAQASRAIDADCRFALTGTPVENNVGDLWSIMEFLNPGLLGSEAAFQRNFFVPIQMMQDAGAAERLKRATGPFMLRRLKTDKSIISDLPEKVETKTYCQLTKEQATLYGAVIEEIGGILGMGDGNKDNQKGSANGGGKGSKGDGPSEEVSEFRRKGIILAALTKLKQVCDHPAVFLKDNSQTSGAAGRSRSGKLVRLTEMLSEVTESGDSALVFTQFVEMGHIIRDHLQESLGREVLFLHGGTPRSQRDAMVERFQEEHGKRGKSGAAEPKIFVVSLRAGGTGLNLTAASHVFHFDRWWNPAVEDQATDRAFRIGQKRNVQVHKMICSGTLEERIDDTIEMKKDVSRMVVGAGEGWLTEMSNEDLRDVLALSADATMAAEEG
ncbi:MAG: DEAD/DEAH box helicase [Nitrosopumilaceae archaeon]|nr:DEAD/DEAH box helicase [Nitrosopumilaceae archaeon]